MDLILFNFIYQFSGKWHWLDLAGIFFAKYFGYFLIGFLVLILLCKFRKYWKTFLFSLLAGVLARMILVSAIRLLWFRQRPFVSQNFIPLISKSPDEAAFPSGHTAFFFAIATIIFYKNKKIGILFYIGSFLISLARIFTGVHWPLDILAGIIIGIAAAVFAKKVLFKKFWIILKSILNGRGGIRTHMEQAPQVFETCL